MDRFDGLALGGIPAFSNARFPAIDRKKQVFFEKAQMAPRLRWVRAAVGSVVEKEWRFGPSQSETKYSKRDTVVSPSIRTDQNRYGDPALYAHRIAAVWSEQFARIETAINDAVPQERSRLLKKLRKMRRNQRLGRLPEIDWK